jgi:uncharacterized LabA/DUF88 family protein
MNILIDYYNLDNDLKSVPFKSFCTTLLEKIPFNNLVFERNISIRLYGGWFEQRIITRKAQELAIEIEKAFPDIYYDISKEKKFIVNTELAYSLICSPNNHLFYTYRTRGVYYGLKVKTSSDLECTDPSCPFDVFYNILKNNKCPICKKPNIQSHFYRSEQKLVDTMLSSDLIFLSFQKSPIILITSDDDLWPAILTGVSLGGNIMHIETKDHNKEFDYKVLLENNKSYSYLKF